MALLRALERCRRPAPEQRRSAPVQRRHLQRRLPQTGRASNGVRRPRWHHVRHLGAGRRRGERRRRFQRLGSGAHTAAGARDVGIWEGFAPGVHLRARPRSCGARVPIRGATRTGCRCAPSDSHWRRRSACTKSTSARGSATSTRATLSSTRTWPSNSRSTASRWATRTFELLPITEHPLDTSWGYQTIGYCAPERGLPQASMNAVHSSLVCG